MLRGKNTTSCSDMEEGALKHPRSETPKKTTKKLTFYQIGLMIRIEDIILRLVGCFIRYDLN